MAGETELGDDATAVALATVSVRTLCDFTVKRGDLDRRFTPSATALEGIQGQQDLASRRGGDYETEIALEAVIDGLRVRGRADGWDPRRRTLEEIKTIRGSPDEIPANRRRLHWAQLETYGALFCAQRGLEEVALALVYLDVGSDSEVELREVAGAQDLMATLRGRCADFAAWARQELAHRGDRDAALRALRLPRDDFRPGQRELAEAVYRVVLRGRSLLAQAPTGIGKTMGTLYPALRAMPVAAIDRLAFLTCKGTGRLTALEALQDLRTSAGGRLRVLTLVAKEQACEHPDKPCHGDACPLARGFYDRLPEARAEAVRHGWLDALTQRRVALAHGICPYYLGQELAQWCDVLVGDVHHLFDARGLLWGLSQAQEWRLAVLVDEAHNLVERVRQMYSGGLSIAQLRAAARAAPAGPRTALQALARALGEQGASGTSAYEVLDEAPEALVRPLLAAGSALAEHFHREPLAVGGLLDFHFELQHLARLVDGLGDHTLLELHRTAPGAPETVEAMVVPTDEAALAPDGGRVVAPQGLGTSPPDGPGSPPEAAAEPPDDVLLNLRNVVPAVWLRARLTALHGLVLFSATLTPPEHQRQMLGLPPDGAWIDVPPAFDPSHLVVRVARGLSTRYAHRGRSLRGLVQVMAAQFDAHPGNYLAFLSSFEYLDQVAGALARARPDIPQWRQDRRMGPTAREAFLARFQPQGQGIGFAVLGGVFAEGVDLPGPLLIGAFIATLGLPPVSPVQQAVEARIARLFGAGQGHADLIPAMHKVVQAAGRVLRTPQDRGWLWLLDDRYRRPDVAALLPAWWGLDSITGAPQRLADG